jgi:trimeric autotransporter adhesin
MKRTLSNSVKITELTFTVAGVLLAGLITFAFRTAFVAALTATTTSATSTDPGPAISLADTSSSALATSASSTVAALAALTTVTTTAPAPVSDNATTTANASSATSSANLAQPHGNGKPALERVRVVGSKYIDFFTDGTTTYSFPGDPLLDCNLNKPNAPTHAGLTWVSSKGMEAYDTSSGDLEPGTYAQEANGSFIANFPGSAASPTSTIPVAFSLLDPTLDTSAPPPTPKTTDASVSHSPAHLADADTASTTSSLPDTSTSASSTPAASTTASASSTPAAATASSTPVVVSATSTATSTAASSSVASSSFASASDNAASTTATQ